MEISPEFILLLAFGFIAFIQLLYFWLLFSRLAFFKNKEKPMQDLPPVSVVICARDEYFNLQKFLPIVLEQDYPDFEVVVVNDNSSDESKGLLSEYVNKYPHLKLVSLDQELNFFSGKKFPLSLGIKSAKNELLLLTDADCKPAGKDWIKNMIRNFDDQADVVLGYGPYFQKKGILNTLIRFDTFMVALQYFSYSLAGLTYMGVGRNLAYRRSLFFKNNGFISHYTISSGDDDLFINQVSNRKNTRIEINPVSYTYSNPKTSFALWFRQKNRHLSTSKHYKWLHKFLLGNWALTQTLFYIGTVVLLAMNVYPVIIISIFVLRLISQLVISKLSLNKLEEKGFWLWIPLLEMFFVIFNPILAVSREMVEPRPSKKSEHDYALVRQAVDAGDQKAFAALLDSYRDAVYISMYKMTNDQLDAEDLTIEAFSKAFKNLHTFTPDFAFSTWLFRIATNNGIDFLRRKKKHMLSIDNQVDSDMPMEFVTLFSAETLDPEEKLIRKQKIKMLHKVVDQLKPHYRELIELFYFSELSYEEISVKMNIPIGTVKAKLFRSREFLYQILKNHKSSI
ncbi:MAG: sigma-70 family RNA polymerase sigma factor [Bacteroidales bacterium]|nr:sigma-70 family RNA polymerase sigma factor [Bacteroidales bacterium]